jgi:hypothetical protein
MFLSVRCKKIAETLGFERNINIDFSYGSTGTVEKVKRKLQKCAENHPLINDFSKCEKKFNIKKHRIN